MGSQSREKYERLQAEDEEPLRKSLDDAYDSASDEDLNLGELDPLHGQGQRLVADDGRRHVSGSSSAHAYNSGKSSYRSSLLRATGCFARCGRWTLIVLTICGSIVALLVSGTVFVYKTTPPMGESPPWYPTPRGGSLISWKDSYTRAAALVNRMSLVEKVNITTGTGWEMGMCVGNTGPANGVQFPALCLQDGPLGLRFVDNITAFPAGLTTGATWNRDLMYKRGRALGVEARRKGVNVLLGPSMGPLGRMPAGGRNWEGFGSDPVLQGVAASETIRGIQDEGVMATAKHYILNEQEHFRQSYEWALPNAMSSNIDDRALHELYLWPFADSIKAGVASVMCSYQMVNNSYACGNSKLLNGILKDELGFQGFVQSDWLAQRSGVASALAGLDMSMPGDGLRWADGVTLWGAELTRAALNTSLPMSRLNDMVTRIVAAWYQLGQDDRAKWSAPAPEGDGGPNFSSWTTEEVGLLHPGSDCEDKGVVNKFVNAQGEGEDSHGKLARQIAAEGTVLVKNVNGILPLKRDGWAEGAEPKPFRKLRIAIFGEDSGPGEGMNACPDRGCNQGTLASGWGSGAVDFPYLVTPLDALQATVNPDKVALTAFDKNKVPFKQAPGMLTHQDICLVFVNSDGGEGFIASGGIRGDRNDLYVQKQGERLVLTVARGCGGGKGRTIVVIHAIGPVVVDRWIDSPGVHAVIMANLPGQESGNALMDVMFGDVNPSGKLPYTVGKSLSDYGEAGQIMYYPNAAIPQQHFDEGLYIDYRHFDKYDISPQFEFGYGLSYTTFNLSDISVVTKKAKSPFPARRPDALEPPSFSEEIPPATEALFPDGFRKLTKYIYPYIESTDDTARGPYPYPDGWETPEDPSPAGGGEGGNPSLWDIHAEVHVSLKNTGPVAGKEVVQLYASFPSNEPLDPETTVSPHARDDSSTGAGDAPTTVDFPVKVLRGFHKIELQPGESKDLSFSLTRRDLSYWNVQHGNWIMPTAGGPFTFRVGTSSRDLPLSVQW